MRLGISGVSALALALIAGACALDLSGNGDLSFDGGGLAPVDGATSNDGSLADVTTAGDAADAESPPDANRPADARVDAPRDAPADVAPVDACPEGGCPPLATCKAIFDATPAPRTSGLYTVDPDGAGPSPPIQVWCDMLTDGGGWTLVGRELPNGSGQFRYLDADTNNPPGIANDTQAGLIGKRFVGLYTDVWIDWGASYIRFTRPPTLDLFANVVGLGVALPAVATNDQKLSGWLTSAGGGKLCVASHDNDVRPGDTSWAVVPKDDNNTVCGCDSMGWAGRGAYYGGAPSGQQTGPCMGFGGGWAGAKDTGEAKGGITQTTETKLWIR